MVKIEKNPLSFPFIVFAKLKQSEKIYVSKMYGKNSLYYNKPCSNSSNAGIEPIGIQNGAVVIVLIISSTILLHDN